MIKTGTARLEGTDMGTFSIYVEMSNPDGKGGSVNLKTEVDTGSDWNVISLDTAIDLEITPRDSTKVTMVDGGKVGWLWGDVRVVYEDEGVEVEAICHTVFAPPDLVEARGSQSHPLIGADTLDELNLLVDTKGKRLIPRHLLEKTS